MLTDPRFDLQKAIVQLLKNSGPVAALVGDRIYDRVPRNNAGTITAKFPFVGLGETQLLPELGEETNAAETTLTLHAWSQEVGFPEVLRIASAVASAVHDADLPIENCGVQSVLLSTSRVLRDPDGITSHAVLTFSILTDANAH
ncbi:DUF3168 domain-containing protein [Bradyrhizobium liaoningense]|uniref:DUF3168 domain-containing protein n=1 Tax=Bradyrhizobium liaoningense TaxID=43992 RepID=UPI0004B900E2|nr:DUF3168 domain-containing protein [Bradyrhizobium liaoningense]